MTKRKSKLEAAADRWRRNPKNFYRTGYSQGGQAVLRAAKKFSIDGSTYRFAPNYDNRIVFLSDLEKWIEGEE